MELKAAKLAIISFTLKERNAISIIIRMDNMTALSYLMKMGYQKPGVDCDEQRNLAIPFEEKDKDYCQILTRFNECRQTGKPGKPWIQANGN